MRRQQEQSIGNGGKKGKTDGTKKKKYYKYKPQSTI